VKERKSGINKVVVLHHVRQLLMLLRGRKITFLFLFFSQCVCVSITTVQYRRSGKDKTFEVVEEDDNHEEEEEEEEEEAGGGEEKEEE
jgi:hypothetical protein